MADLSDDDAARRVRTCPQWTVHDVVAHLSGVCADSLAGNMEGAPSPEWTAAQVEPRRGRPIVDLLAEWGANAPRMEEQMRGRLSAAGIADVASHEQDIRTALGRAGERDNDAIRYTVDWFVPMFGSRVAHAGLPAVRVATEDGSQVAGDGEPEVTLTLSRFELFRAGFGRRSADQIAGLFSGGDPLPYVDALVVFGPAEADVIE